MVAIPIVSKLYSKCKKFGRNLFNLKPQCKSHTQRIVKALIEQQHRNERDIKCVFAHDKMLETTLTWINI